MKHVHFIGICGVGMGALAIMMKNKGWKVTGSDVGFYPPVSLHLKKFGIEYYSGWHVEKIGTPDLVVVGNVAGSENPEWKYVQDNKISYVSYPELIARELVRKNSIVCAGTYGKTSTTALLTWILKNANYKPAYMFGGLSETPELSSDDLGGQWSILEGDEYKTSRWDNNPKFSHYSPTHLLLTAIKWDHADVYPTEQNYFEAFEKLVKMIPKDGLIVTNKKILDNKILNIKKIISNIQYPISVVTYGQTDGCDYNYSEIIQTKEGLSFNIIHQNKTYQVKTNLIGEYQAENICGAFAMANAIVIPTEKIISAISNFQGIKRRLEKRGQTIGGADIFDDIAHSPAKAKSVLDALKKTYQTKIIAIFEPNTGNRENAAMPGYDHAFDGADLIIIPRLTKIKTTPGQKHVEGPELMKIISKTHNNVKYFEDDNELINFIKQNAAKGDAVVFLGSHGFRGMIESIIN